MNLAITVTLGNGDQITYARQVAYTTAQLQAALTCCGFTAAEIQQGLTAAQTEWDQPPTGQQPS